MSETKPGPVTEEVGEASEEAGVEEEAAVTEAAEEAESEAQTLLTSYPDFSIICSFFNKFGSFLGLKPQPFSRLQSMLTFDEEGRVDKGLVDLHVQLMRRAGQKTATHKKWEQCLMKYLEWDPVVVEECRTVERFGYAHAPLPTKLSILKTLCERQFDWNPKFKEQVSACSARELRLLPVGVDKEGKGYWYQLDGQLNLRIYSEEPDDDAGRTWTLRAESRACLHGLIQELESGKKTDDPSESSNEAQDTDKPQPSTSSDPEEKEEQSQDEVKEPTKTEPSADVPEKPDAPTIDAATEEISKSSEKPESPKEEPNNPDVPMETTEADLVDKPEKSLSPEEEGKEEPEDKPEEPDERKDEPDDEAQVKKVKATKPPNGNVMRIKGQMTRKGTTLDTFQDVKPKAEPKPVSSGEESRDNLPEELKPFIERRILPRRSTRSANTNFKDLADGKNAVKQAEPEAEAEKTESEERVAPVLEEEEEEESSASEGDDGSSDDDDFIPLSALRDGKGGRRKRKRVDFDDCDSDVEGGEVVPKKTRKVPTNNSHCGRCAKSKNPEVLLLCDNCDDAWHTWCLRPQLWYVPDEDWFCPKCQHGFLLAKLKSALAALDEELARKDEEKRRKEAESNKKKRQQERLKREMDFIGISLNNIISTRKGETPPSDNEEDESGSESEEDSGEERAKRKRKPPSPVVPIAIARTKRNRNRVDYTFNEYDEMVTEAMEDLLEGSTEQPKPTHDPARPTGGAGRGKDMATIIQQQAEDNRERDREGSDGSGEKAKPRPLPKKSRPKLTDLEDPEEGGMEDESDEEYAEPRASGSESEFEPEEEEEDDEEFMPKGRAAREGVRRSARLCTQPTASDEDFVVSGSGSEDDYKPKKKTKKPPPKKPQKKGRRKYETSESEDSLLEGKRSDSEEEDSDSDYGKKKSKKSTTGSGGRTRGKRVNYRKLAETSEDEDEEEEDGDETKEGPEEKEKKSKKTEPLSKSERPTGAYRRAKIESEGEEYEEEDEASEDKSEDDEEEKEEEQDEEEEGKSEAGDDSKDATPPKAPAKKTEAKKTPEKKASETNGAPAKVSAPKARIITPAPVKPEGMSRVVMPVAQRGSPLPHSGSNSPLGPAFLSSTAAPSPLARPTPPPPQPMSGFYAVEPNSLASLEAMKPYSFPPQYGPPPPYPLQRPPPYGVEGGEEGTLGDALSSAMSEESDYHQL